MSPIQGIDTVIWKQQLYAYRHRVEMRIARLRALMFCRNRTASSIITRKNVAREQISFDIQKINAAMETC